MPEKKKKDPQSAPEQDAKVEAPEETKAADSAPETQPEQETAEQKLQEQLDQLNDRLLRTLAEYDNYRKRSIKEKSIVCLECGKTFKVITKKHLALHGLDAVSYREKWGLKKGTLLTCKELQRARRQKMKDMKLWEKRALARKAMSK